MKQTLTIRGRIDLSKFVILATIVFLGLAAIVPYRAYTQDESEIGEATQTTPLIGVTSSTKNPLQVALLHWYDANQTASFAVGFQPFALAFDGANIWVANLGSHSVTKLRASDGATLGTFGVEGPLGVAFDGGNVWVTNSGINAVTKLRASDGKTLGTFAVGTNPIGVAFDGANVWVANTIGNTVTKLRASDGKTLGTFEAGGGPYNVAFDGANSWVTNNGSKSMSKLRASDGKTLGKICRG